MVKKLSKELLNKSLLGELVWEELLVPFFLDILEECKHPSAEKLDAEWISMLDEEESLRDDTDGLDMLPLLLSVYEALNEVAPKGYRFGLKVFGGMDFGFWKEAEIGLILKGE